MTSFFIFLRVIPLARGAMVLKGIGHGATGHAVRLFVNLWNKRICRLLSRWHMMTSSNGNIFRVTGPLCGEFPGHRGFPPRKGQCRGTLIFSLICAWTKARAKNRNPESWNADDLRRHHAHYEVTVMCKAFTCSVSEDKNIERHTAHTIVSLPNLKQWQMGHISDLTMIIR